jgi:hypothetical protein
MFKPTFNSMLQNPEQKAQELNAAIMQAVAAGHHVVLEIEEREYSVPRAYKYPQIKLRSYSIAKAESAEV